MIRFDAYTATTRQANPYQLVDLLKEVAGEDATAKEGRGFHNFGRRVAFTGDDGAELGYVQWGGMHGDLSMIEVKGERTPQAVDALRARYWHRVTRVDSCADFDAPRAFERLLGPCMDVKRSHRLKGERRGDWDDYPELGRTQMIGSPKSVAMVRLYEKGKQPEYRHLDKPNWARLELQVRPAKEAKTTYNEATPEQVWGATAWTRELASLVLEEHVSPHPAGTVYRQPERERALAWMCKQYGSHLVSLAADLGSWECLGKTLQEMVSESNAR